jgi:hypothetical protein
MRWIFEVAMIGIASGWKWLLASVGVVGAVVGILFAVGVLGGGGDADLPPFTASPTPTPATASTIVPTLEPTAAPAAKIISVPILATRAENVGSLEFVLIYDPAILEFNKLEPGLLASSALIDSSSSHPGRIWAGIVDVEGINGSGPVAVVKFKVRGEIGGALPLTLENIAAFDASTLADIVTTTTPGQFDGPDLALLSPLVTFQ